jgi:hypothetical protein
MTRWCLLVALGCITPAVARQHPGTAQKGKPVARKSRR